MKIELLVIGHLIIQGVQYRVIHSSKQLITKMKKKAYRTTKTIEIMITMEGIPPKLHRKELTGYRTLESNMIT